jgi:phytoene synthase
MQLTNIARDVGEDARNGRLYLPLQWLREAGIDPDAWLARPVFNEALASVIERLLMEADNLYMRSDAGIAGLPMGCRPGINAARYLYAEIGRQVERQGLDSINRRAVVPSGRKVKLLAPILGTAILSPRYVAAPPLEETRFLVDAVVYAGRRGTDAGKAPAGVGERVIWVLELFQQLEERERATTSQAVGQEFSVGRVSAA